MSVMVPSPIAGILAPLASTKFMACLHHSEAPSSQQFQRPEGAVLIASQTQTGYWMPRLRRAVTGRPAFAGGIGCPAFAGRLLDAPLSRGGYWMPRFRGAGQPYFHRRQVLRTGFATLKSRIIQ